MQLHRLNNYWVQKYTEYVTLLYHTVPGRPHKILKFENSYIYGQSDLTRVQPAGPQNSAPTTRLATNLDAKPKQAPKE